MPRTITPTRARATPWRPRILVYGESGAGKTTLGLDIAKLTGAKTLVIDTEHGTDTYGKDFDFDVIHADSPEEIEAQIDYYAERPEGYTLLIIDPISCVHAALEAQADDELRPKKGPAAGKFGAVFDPGVRAQIKRINRRLPAKLRKLDMAQIVTARAKPNWKVTTGPTGKIQMERIGSTWEGDNSLDYEFDIILELLVYGVGEHANRVAVVRKARGMKLPDKIEEFSATKLLDMLPRSGFVRVSDPHPMVTEEQARRIHDLVAALRLEPGALTRALNRWGATMIEDLPRSSAEQIIATLEARRAGTAAPQATPQSASASASVSQSQPQQEPQPQPQPQES